MAAKIHGSTDGNKRPALDGLFDTLQKKYKISELGDYVLSNHKVTNYVIQKKQKLHQQVFHIMSSKANILRSIATYYTASVMGKRKYQAVRVSTSMTASAKKRGGKTAITFMPGCTIPRCLHTTP